MTAIGTMRILVAPNSFKESLNSRDIAKHIRAGLQKASKKFHITELPLADGGTGTVYILTQALDGQFIKCKVTGPLGKGVDVTYGIVPQQKLAIIELAEAAGLSLVPQKNRNPLVTTTQGVGELLLDAVQRGYKKIILGIGDSATIDCGVGALSVLGVRFLDKTNSAIEPTCRGLLALKKIDISGLYHGMKNVRIIIAADVNNVLTGKKGALMYAEQKGARAKMIPIIQKALRNFRKIVLHQFNVDLDGILGSGAAGGIGGAMKVILNAEIMSGFGIVQEIVFLEDEIKKTDVVITGEGRIDKQTFFGKSTKKVVDIAHRYKKPVILIAGSLTKDAKHFYKYGVIRQYTIIKSAASLRKAMKHAPELLKKVSYRVGKDILDLSIPETEGD